MDELVTCSQHMPPSWSVPFHELDIDITSLTSPSFGHNPPTQPYILVWNKIKSDMKGDESLTMFY